MLHTRLCSYLGGKASGRYVAWLLECMFLVSGCLIDNILGTAFRSGAQSQGEDNLEVIPFINNMAMTTQFKAFTKALNMLVVQGYIEG